MPRLPRGTETEITRYREVIRRMVHSLRRRKRARRGLTLPELDILAEAEEVLARYPDRDQSLADEIPPEEAYVLHYARSGIQCTAPFHSLEAAKIVAQETEDTQYNICITHGGRVVAICYELEGYTRPSVRNPHRAIPALRPDGRWQFIPRPKGWAGEIILLDVNGRPIKEGESGGDGATEDG